MIRRLVGEDGKELVRLYWLLASGTDAAIRRHFGSKYGPRYEARLEALRQLRDMAFGVPKQGLELTGADGGPIRVQPVRLDTLTDEQLAQLEAADAIVRAPRS